MNMSVLILIFFFMSLFLVTVHPFYLSLILMMISIFMSLFFMVVLTHWFNYIILLVYVSGLLIIFIYMSSILPNVYFSSMNFMVMLMVSFFISLSLITTKMSGKVDLMLKSFTFTNISVLNWSFILMLLLFLVMMLLCSVEFSFQKSVPMRML